MNGERKSVNIRQFFGSGFLLILAAVGAWLWLNSPKTDVPRWETLPGSRDRGADSLTLVVDWAVGNDGRGPADSFVVNLWIYQPSSGNPPQSIQQSVRGNRYRLTIPLQEFPPRIDLRATVQGFRGVQISRPVSSAWQYPLRPGSLTPVTDSLDNRVLRLELGLISFEGRRTTASPPPPARVDSQVSTRPSPQRPAPGGPSVTPPGCQNEPDGYNRIGGGPWDAVPRAGQARDEWRMQARPDRIRIVEDPTVPQPDKRVIEGVFPQGHPGGRGPFNVIRVFPDHVQSIYMCMLVYLSDNFTNNGNAGTKFGFILTPYLDGPNKPNHYFNLANQLGINLQGRGGLNRNMRSRFNMVQHRGQWVRTEWLVTANTKGGSDGVARIWANGQLVLNVTNVRYFFPTQDPAFRGVTWNPTYGGGSNPVPYDMYQRIGEWYISGR